jgi:hypothetical protein
MQQKRTNAGRNDSRNVSDLKALFVDNAFQSKEEILEFEACFNLSKANQQQKHEDEFEATCSSNFKAASEYPVSEKFTDNGVVAGCCRHDIVLRLHNIKNTGEKLLYAYRLLKSVLEDQNCPEVVVIFYDINCKFSKYLKVIKPFHSRTYVRKEWLILLHCMHGYDLASVMFF